MFPVPPRALVLPLALALAGLVGTALPAAAHAQLVGSEPAGGATLDEPPPAVVLEFDEGIEADFARLEVTDPAGERVDQGPPSVEGVRVSVPLGGLRRIGGYSVAYRVVSADGHPVEGSFTFDVTEVSAAEPSPQPTPTGATATPAPGGPTETQAPAAAEDAEPTGATDEGLPILPLAVGVLVVLLAAGAVAANRRPGARTRSGG